MKNSIGSNDIALRFPGSFFLIPALINRIDLGFGYTEEYLRSPQFQYDYNFAWTVSGAVLPATAAWPWPPAIQVVGQ